MAKVLEKAEQMFAVSVVPKNAEPKRSIVEKIPAEGHQQYRAVVDFAVPEFRPRSIVEKIPAEGDGLSITMQEELNTITLPFYT